MRLDAHCRARRDRARRGSAGGARSDPGRLGGARDRERGRGAGVPDPCLGTRIRLSELVHVAFGGSGPVHALAIARKLRIPRVVFPIGAGIMSALGLLASPLGFEVSRSRRVFVAGLDAGEFERNLAPLVEEASGFLHRAGVADPRHRLPAGHALPGPGLRDRGDRPRGRLRRRPRRGILAPGRAVPRQVRRDLRGDVSRRAPRDRELEGGGGRARRRRSATTASGAAHAGGRSGPAGSGSATPSSNARCSTDTRSRRARRSRVRPSSRSASPPACSARETGRRWTNASISWPSWRMERKNDESGRD